MKTAPSANAPFYIRGLIAGLDLSAHTLGTSPPVVKCLLFLIYHHMNASKGYAWASQKILAREMGGGLRTIERAFADVKRLNVVTVRRIRTGKHPRDCYNQYWLNIPRLRELQGEHPTQEAGDNTEQPPSKAGDKATNTRQVGQEHPPNRTRTPAASGGEGLEVKQYSYKGSTTTPQSGNQKTVSTLRSRKPSVASPTNGHNNPQQESNRQDYIRKTIAAIHSLYKDIHKQETGPDAHYDQTKDEIKRLRRLAGTYRKSLQQVGHHDMTGLYERTAKTRV